MTDSDRNAEYVRRYRTRRALAEQYPDADVEPKDVIVVRQGSWIALYSDDGTKLGAVKVARS